MRRKIQRIIAVLTVSLALYSCGGAGNGGNNNPSPNNPNSITYYNVPNWDSLMLYGRIVKTNTTPEGVDSMLAYTRSGVSYIKYRNIEYTVKAYDPIPANPTATNSQVYFVDVFQNNTKIFGGFAHPKKYQNNGQWVTSSIQALSVGQGAGAPFNDYVISGGQYYSY